MSQLVFAFDVVNSTLVSFQGSSIKLDRFRQGVFSTKIYFVQPVQAFIQGSAQYESFDFTGYDGIRVGFWKDCSGALDNTDPNKLALTDQLGWTYDTTTEPETPFFTGDLNLLTQAMIDWISTGKSKKCYFAVNLVKGADLRPVLDQTGAENSNVYAATDHGTGQGVNTTGAIPRIRLPLEVLDPTSGELYTLTRTAPGVLEWTWTNQP